MRALLLLAALAAALSSLAAAQDPCMSNKNESACWTASCNWCRTATVPPSCLSWAGASKLPPSVFACGNSSRPDCGALKTQASCYAATGCSWCICAAVPSSCKNVDTAKKAPPSVFNCTWM